jgi:hypothetical protein
MLPFNWPIDQDTIYIQSARPVNLISLGRADGGMNAPSLQSLMGIGGSRRFSLLADAQNQYSLCICALVIAKCVLLECARAAGKFSEEQADRIQGSKTSWQSVAHDE